MVAYSLCYYAPPAAPVREGHYKMNTGVRPSVRPSVCRVPRPNSRMERPKEPKIGSMETNHTT